MSFDAYGYAVVFVANICTAVYLASIARIGNNSSHLQLIIKRFQSSVLFMIQCNAFQVNLVASIALVSCGAMVRLEDHIHFDRLD